MKSDEERLRAGEGGVRCAECGRPVDPGETWQPGIYGEVYCQECADRAWVHPDEKENQ